MMYDSASSPFDQALSTPLLLNEPIKKKWSLFSSSCNESTSSSSSSSSSTSSSCSATDNDNHRAAIVTTATPQYEAPDLEEQAMMMTSMLADETIEVDLAILRERHEEIAEINGSMRQVHDIQKDLALIVDSQESYIKHMSTFAIEAYDEAEAGWAHVQAIQKGLPRRLSLSLAVSSSSSSSTPMNLLNRKQRATLLGMMAALLMVMGVYWVFMMNTADDAANPNGSPSSATAADTP